VSGSFLVAPEGNAVKDFVAVRNGLYRNGEIRKKPDSFL
jgi:hypothetical protein